MSASLDANLGTKAATVVASTTLVTAAAVAVGADIILEVGRFNFANTTISVSGGGLTWVEETTLNSGATRNSVFRANAPSGLAINTTLTITFSAAENDTLICAYSVLGLNTSGGPSAASSNNGTGTGWGTGSMAAASGDAMFGGTFTDGAVTTSTPTSPAVEIFDFNNAGQNESETLIWKSSVSGTDSCDGTWAASTTWVAGGVAYPVTPTFPPIIVPDVSNFPKFLLRSV